MDKTIEHKLERAKVIVNEIANLANVIAKNAAIAFPPKRLFRKKGKRPLKRLKRQRALVAMGFAPAMARMQVDMIMAQPIPNFVPGGVSSSGAAIVGESDRKEIIITPNGTITTTNQHPHPHQQPPDPIRPVP